MNVSLTPELENVIAEKVDAGMYSSASEVVREGLRLLQQRDEMYETKLAALKGDIRVGLDSIDAGRYRDGGTVMNEIKRRLLERKRQDG